MERAITRAITQAGAGGQSPDSAVRALFANGEQGAWYDPSDISTMFQDSAGTTPVTAAGQPVGLIMDKSGRANHASQPTSASRPVLQTDGTRWWLAFDGVDDFLSTGSINFTGTDKFTVITGIRKLTDAALGMAVELSTGSGNGRWYMLTDIAKLMEISSFSTANNRWRYTDPQAAPTSGVWTLDLDIARSAGQEARLRKNGAAVGTSVDVSNGTGNYGNYPIYIGRRAGTSLPFNGRLYQLIVRGATTADLVPVETFVNSKTGAY